MMQTQEIVRLNGIYKRLLTNAGVTMLEGEGKVVGPHVVEVTQPDGSKQQYKAKHILIATGSRAQPVNIPGKVLFLPDHAFSSATTVTVTVFTWSCIEIDNNMECY